MSVILAGPAGINNKDTCLSVAALEVELNLHLPAALNQGFELENQLLGLSVGRPHVDESDACEQMAGACMRSTVEPV